MKRIFISLTLSLSTVLSWSQIEGDVPYCFENISRNPAVTGKMEYVSGQDAYDGVSMELSSGSTAEFSVRLEASSSYVFSAMVRTSSGEDVVSAEVSGLGSNNVTVSTAKSGWTEVRADVNVSGIPGKIMLTFVSESSSPGASAWVDNIIFKRTGPYVEKIRNGISPMPARRIREDRGVRMQPDSAMAWMQDAKFGMFIHWGLYSGPGRGEWYMERSGMSPEEYRRFAYPESGDQYFSASAYNPSEWAELAKAAGMKYMNMTAQHHDGYALFESRYIGAFTSKQTHNRDFVREYVEACRKAGLRVGLYKTLINWRYPGYYDITGTDCKKNRFGYVTDSSHRENARLMKEELYCQVKELVTNYGEIDQLFWDGGWLGQQGSDADAAYFWESGKYLDPSNPWPVNEYFRDYEDSTGRALGLMGMVRKYQPHILVNPRSGWCGDYRCEEGGTPVTGPVRTEDIYEKCMSVGPGWGYSKVLENPEKVMSSGRIIRMLSDCVIRNMNLLLNVGPDRFGRIPDAVRRPLLETGKWLEKVGCAVYGTRGGPWDPVDGMYGYAYRDNVIYVYFLGDSPVDEFSLPAVNRGQKLLRAYNVETGEPVRAEQKPSRIISMHDIGADAGTVTIIAVELSAPVMPAI